MKKKVISAMVVVLFIGSTLEASAISNDDTDCFEYAQNAIDAEVEAYGEMSEVSYDVGYGWYLGLCQASENILDPVFK